MLSKTPSESLSAAADFPSTELPPWAEEPPVPPEGGLVPGSRFPEEQWVMAAGMLARGSSFLHVARAMGCSRTTLWRAYYGSQALRVRVWWERQALNREAELRLSSLRDLVIQQVERLVAAGDPATVRWAADRLGLFAGLDAGSRPSQTPAHQPPAQAPSDLAEAFFGPSATPGIPAFDDDAVPGALREADPPDPAVIAAILARPEADGPKGVYPWTLNPDDDYPGLVSAQERRGEGAYKRFGVRRGH